MTSLRRNRVPRSLLLAWILALGVGIALASNAAKARAQAPIAFGGQISFADDTDFGVGARVLVGTGTIVPNSRLVGSFDLFFPASKSENFPGVGTVTADPSYWELNVNAHVLFPIEKTPVDLYAGTGLHLYDGSVDVSAPDLEVRGFDPDGTGVGINLLGGIEFAPTPAFTTFAELKIEIAGAEQVVLSLGAWF